MGARKSKLPTASLSSNAKDSPVNTGNIVDNSHETSIPIPFKGPISPNNRFPVPILIPVIYNDDQIIRDERLPDAPTKTAATDSRHHEKNEEPQLRLAQLAELAVLSRDIDQTEREIIQEEKDISVLEGLIAEQEAKMARKRFLDFENWLKSEVYSTGNRTEESDKANLSPSPKP